MIWFIVGLLIVWFILTNLRFPQDNNQQENSCLMVNIEERLRYKNPVIVKRLRERFGKME